MKILLEMRPALEGHAGIPQETRLTFQGLNSLPGVSVDGLIQSGGRVLASGLPARRLGRSLNGHPSGHTLPRDVQLNRLAQVVISLRERPGGLLPRRLADALAAARSGLSLVAGQLFGRTQELTHFDTSHYRDFIWQSMFAKTLHPRHFDAVAGASYRVAAVPWGAMHRFGMLTRALSGRARYPHLDTRGYDVMIAETPYPGRMTRGTALVVRYHDAIPLLMPHTISDRAYHQASHYQALRSNVLQGAYFSCVSDATRADLLSIFPQAAARVVTIPNAVSEAYFPEESPRERVPDILALHRHATMLRRADAGYAHDAERNRYDDSDPSFDYLLMVSTLEPRKNHLRLLSAWERLRSNPRHRRLRLVLVGMLGWDHKPIVQRCRPWMGSGEVMLLEDVPADELRLLYRHAAVTVCPSLYEGFDFSGIEAMRSGGIVAASDIAAHRGVFADAAAYFNPYSVEALAAALERLLGESREGVRRELIEAGARNALRFLPERILPQWHDFLRSVTSA
ncbi:glycosyltransferase family 4 protein [Aquabacterium sp.]|uniref:glycosyltransferase family 4 protein n=1 Tax=Aquabacterium sp. TaxID=1872578 RepID=UPI002CBA5A95|nr:glycosyltransferase family 1 protein [Aquabacterium sp.]HSW07420.1 glycosyltransferase family 1 protein [Aquabacterium sp.]